MFVEWILQKADRFTLLSLLLLCMIKVALEIASVEALSGDITWFAVCS